ncbi:hypothetical protein HN51_032667 [Arachis hypogaea]|nr:uncharacterized protein DS421_10g308640 [Arachis hypogaea]
MMKISIKIAFVMILFALIATNGFALQKTPTNREPKNNCPRYGCNFWPGGCSYFTSTCAPFFPVCEKGCCQCRGPNRQ